MNAKLCIGLLPQNPMYSFSESSHEDPQALEDIVAEQTISLNALQQLSDSLKWDADHFRSVSAEQQVQIDQMRQQVLLQFHTTQATSMCIYTARYINLP